MDCLAMRFDLNCVNVCVKSWPEESRFQNKILDREEVQGPFQVNHLLHKLRPDNLKMFKTFKKYI